MSDDALNIYENHLAEQLGEDGVFTEKAIYDPDGENKTIYGIFDENTYRGNIDDANVSQKITGPHFVVASILSFNIYDNKWLRLIKRNKTFIIDYVDTDEQGMQMIWLRG